MKTKAEYFYTYSYSKKHSNAIYELVREHKSSGKGRMQFGKYRLAFGRKWEERFTVFFYEKNGGKWVVSAFMEYSGLSDEKSYMSIAHGRTEWEKPERLKPLVQAFNAEIETILKEVQDAE